MARAAAATALLNRELKSLSQEGSSASRPTQTVSKDTENLAKSANKAEGSMSLLAASVATLGPALVPISALIVPAVTGIANQFGALAVAGGTAVLAFQGIGDALKAFDKAALAPTATNIAAARVAMEDLSPAAQNLVLQLEKLGPVLEDLRATAADGLLPGVSQSIDDLKSRIPEIQQILQSVSQTTGHLVADAGASLASSKFDDFFKFLATEVPVTLVAVGKSAGNLVHALAEMWMAFTPLNNDFNSWLVSATAEIDKFATGLSNTQGFADFIDYVRTNGPQVAATAGALANALIQIAQAAAPIGGPVLKGVEALANALGSLADSNLGTPIMAAVAAMGLLNFATKGYEGIIGTSFGAKTKGSITGMVTEIKALATAQNEAHVSALGMAKATPLIVQQSSAIREGLTTIGKGAAVAGALAIASSGLGDKMGYANTATLGLIGTIGGPYGVAAGAAVGVALDVAKSNNDMADAVDHVNQIMRDAPSAFAVQSQAIDVAIAKQREFQQAVEGDGSFLDALTHSFNPQALQNTISNLFGTSEIDKQKQAIIALENEQAGLVTTWTHVAQVFGQSNTGFRAGTASLTQLQGLANKIKPAMDALGISFKDLQNADPSQMRSYVHEIENYNTAADSTKGRTSAFLHSLTSLNSHLLSTADSAGTLSDALNNLFGPKLNAEQAADALTTSLQAMEKTLKGNTKTFQGNTKAALDNRSASRQAFSDTLASLTAQAQAGAGVKQIASSLRDARARFIEEGVAAGFSAKQMAARAKALGLTPKLVETIFKAVGLDIQQARLRDLTNAIHKLPKSVQTTLKQNGYDLSKSQIVDLTKKYHLTPTQVSTLLSASDKASALIQFVQAQADKLDRSHPNVPLDANPVPALQSIARVQQAINSLRGTTVTNYVNTVRTQGGPQVGHNAAGSVLDFYAGGDVRDRHVAEIAPAGAMRVWAEPETKGESYIPLADDWRRPRAQEIWRETGRRIGMGWMEFAQGAVLGRTAAVAPVVNVTASQGGPVEIRGTVNLDTGRLVGTMRTIADQAVDDAAAFSDTQRGRHR